jgi:type IV pilus assembly protein PilM
LKDPPPAYAFELSETGIAVAATASLPQLSFHPLAPGILAVSPLRDNVLMPDSLAAAVRAATPPNGKRRDAALILPDNCVRVSVLDFDGFPPDPKEQLPLVKFRLKKSVPFDIESSVVSYFPQPGAGKKMDVVAAVAPLEIIARYEAPFRAAGLSPGLITTSALAALRLVAGRELIVIAKLSGPVLVLMVVDGGVLKLIRCLEMAHPSLDEIASDLYPTCVFVEDQFGRKAEKLLLCGFGNATDRASRQFSSELGVPAEVLTSRLGAPSESNAGLIGYLHSVMEGA